MVWKSRPEGHGGFFVVRNKRETSDHQTLVSLLLAAIAEPPILSTSQFPVSACTHRSLTKYKALCYSIKDQKETHTWPCNKEALCSQQEGRTVRPLVAVSNNTQNTEEWCGWSPTQVWPGPAAPSSSLAEGL